MQFASTAHVPSKFTANVSCESIRMLLLISCKCIVYRCFLMSASPNRPEQFRLLNQPFSHTFTFFRPKLQWNCNFDKKKLSIDFYWNCVKNRTMLVRCVLPAAAVLLNLSTKCQNEKKVSLQIAYAFQLPRSINKNWVFRRLSRVENINE